jgi:hypothetical protein
MDCFDGKSRRGEAKKLGFLRSSGFKGVFDLLHVAVNVEGYLRKLVSQAPVAALARGEFRRYEGNQGNRFIQQAVKLIEQIFRHGENLQCCRDAGWQIGILIINRLIAANDILNRGLEGTLRGKIFGRQPLRRQQRTG